MYSSILAFPVLHGAAVGAKRGVKGSALGVATGVLDLSDRCDALPPPDTPGASLCPMGLMPTLGGNPNIASQCLAIPYLEPKG